jgi:hypothetical protein
MRMSDSRHNNETAKQRNPPSVEHGTSAVESTRARMHSTRRLGCGGRGTVALLIFYFFIDFFF